MFKRLRERFGRTNEEGKRVPARKPGGHGDHWACIFGDPRKGDLLELIRTAISEETQPEVVRSPGGVTTAYRSRGEDVRTCVLVLRQEVISAYPEIVSEQVWPIKVREIVPWVNGVEGQVTGSCMGTEVSLFDTRFYASANKYTPGDTYYFHVGALAYRLGPAENLEVETDSEENGGATKISLQGARAYMPANLANEAADIDDFWFYSPLEEPPSRIAYQGRTLRKYAITMALPDEFEMRVPIYAAEHNITPQMPDVGEGDDVLGYLWLQGYLAG